MTALRDIERDSIRTFVEGQADKLTGRVLDYGCGQQPYRDIVEAAGGEYVGFDQARYPASTVSEDVGPSDWPLGFKWRWNAILCTQVIQYVDPAEIIHAFRNTLAEGGWLVMTGPTNWPVIEPEDLYRYTCAGVAHLLGRVFPLVECHSRASVEFGGERWSLGWGAVAQA